jgi:hypothetical protein
MPKNTGTNIPTTIPTTLTLVVSSTLEVVLVVFEDDGGTGEGVGGDEGGGTTI